MKNSLRLILLGCLLALSTAVLPAQVPTLLNYQGRVAVNGVNFEGSGAFKFALVDGGVNQNVTATAYPSIGGLGDGMGPRVLAINIINGGSGYISPPAVTIFHPIGSGAAATATITGGVVTAITVTANGIGYGNGPTTVTIAPPPPNIVPSVSYWSNDGSSVAASEPGAAVTLTVTKGLYSVLLGDTTLVNMAAIPATAFANPDVRLRVWFDDGVTGSQLLAPDQRLAPTAYLANGSVTSAALTDDSVVASKIAPAAITGSRIAPGSLDFSHLAVPVAPGAGQVLGFDGSNLSWTAPDSGGGGIWALNGTTAYYNAGKVGLGTSTPAHTLGIAGGPVWTANSWSGAVEFTNPSAIGWRANSAGYAFGMGHTNGGFAMFRTTSQPGTTASPALYDLFIDDNGTVCINTLSPNAGYKLAVNGGVQFTPGGFGGTLQFGTPNSETGMTITGSARADLRFDGTTWKLYAGPGPGPPGLGAGIAVRTSGLVGIGTENPVSKLEIAAQDALTMTGYQPFLTLRDSNAGNTRARVQSVAGGLTLETESFINGSNGNNYAQLSSSGNFSVKSLTIRGGADLAEPFALSERDVPVGSVVSIDPAHPGKLKKSATAYDRKVAGIVSGANGIHPGISMIQEDALEAGENVALSGRVYVRADTSAGAIEPGDFLTTSGHPGQAMKASDHERSQGAILGKAMTALANGDGLVLVLVTLQ